MPAHHLRPIPPSHTITISTLQSSLSLLNFLTEKSTAPQSSPLVGQESDANGFYRVRTLKTAQMPCHLTDPSISSTAKLTGSLRLSRTS